MKPTYSVLDLGSNSFHMIYARVDKHGQVVLLDKFKQYVSLGSGLKKNGDIRRGHRHAALNCLREVARVLKRQKPDCFAAIATNAFRLQRNDRFLCNCERVLGHPIRVLTSEEEGDYVYQGAVQTTPMPGPDHCILDVGGSSTELILGSTSRPSCILSWQVGSAVLTERFFHTDRLKLTNWNAAVEYTDQVIAPENKAQIYLPGIQVMYGTSGAIRAISNTLRKLGFTDGTIDAEAIDQLVAVLIDKRVCARLTHLDNYRVQVFLGGLAILHALFELLEVKRLKPACGSIREGVLLEMHQMTTKAKAA